MFFSEVRRFAFLGLFLLTSCITSPMPIDDQALAKAAIEAAKMVDAGRFAPAQIRQAELHYSQGQKFLDQKDHSKARNSFIQARILAERAENTSRAQRAKLGEDF